MLLPPTELDDNPTPPAPFQNEEEDPVLLQKLAAFAIVPTTAEEEAIKKQNAKHANLSIQQSIYLSNHELPSSAFTKSIAESVKNKTLE
jgi:hypothetical protein